MTLGLAGGKPERAPPGDAYSLVGDDVDASESTAAYSPEATVCRAVPLIFALVSGGRVLCVSDGIWKLKHFRLCVCDEHNLAFAFSRRPR